MSPPALLISVPVALLVTAVVAVPLGRAWGSRAGYLMAAVLATAGGVLAGLIPEVLDRPLSAAAPWVPAIGAGWQLHLDALSLVFALVITSVGAVVMAYSAQYLGEEHDPSRYFGVMMGFAAAMTLLVLAGDALVLYLGWEATTLSSYALIASGDGGRRPALRALLLTFAGGVALLAAMLLAGVQVGTSTLSQLSDPAAWADASAIGFLLLLVIAASVKSAQVPFHPWLLGAMAAPTPVSAYLHAAAMVTAGLYLLLRFAALLSLHPVIAAAVVAIGTVTAVFTSAAAMRQDDMKKLLAYSTSSQLGFMFALVGVGRPAAIAGAIVYFVAHATYKSALFLSAGVYDHVLGSRQLPAIRGSAGRLPMLTGGVVAACAAMAGVIPALAYVGKEEGIRALLHDTGDLHLPVVVGILTALSLTVAYSIRIAAAPFRSWHGSSAGAERSGAASHMGAMSAAVAILAAVGVGLGLFARDLTPLVDAAVESALGRPPDRPLGLWHGISPAFVASVVIWVAGAAVFAASQRRGWWRTLPEDLGTRAWDGVGRWVGRLGGALVRPLAHEQPSGHLATVLLVASAAIWVALALTPSPASALAADSVPRWVVSILIAAATVAVAQAGDRFTSLALLAGVGFLIAAWYVQHGAPHLAAVQLAVDGLMVALTVFVMRKLPRAYPQVRRSRRIGAAVAGLLGGGAFAGLSFTSRADTLPPAAETYLAHARSSSAHNVVAAVISDFRALDTLGETTVIAVAAIGVVTAVRSGGPVEVDTVIARTSARVVVPLATALSAWLLLRGHVAVGGGFIAAVVLALALVLQHITMDEPRITRPTAWGLHTLVGLGLLALTGYGLLGYAWGDGFLASASAHLTVPAIGRVALPSSLLFEAAVAFVVVTMAVAMLREVGGERR